MFGFESATNICKYKDEEEEEESLEYINKNSESITDN